MLSELSSHAANITCPSAPPACADTLSSILWSDLLVAKVHQNCWIRLSWCWVQFPKRRTYPVLGRHWVKCCFGTDQMSVSLHLEYRDEKKNQSIKPRKTGPCCYVTFIFSLCSWAVFHLFIPQLLAPCMSMHLSYMHSINPLHILTPIVIEVCL